MARKFKKEAIEFTEIVSMEEALMRDTVGMEQYFEAANESKAAETDSSDPTRAYFSEMHKNQRLTAAEEIELGHRIQRGEAQARHRMIECNLKLVVKIANQYLHRGVPLADLIEEGNIGLMTAVDKFDPARGCRFSTHAVWWIRDSIQRAIMSQTRTVRLPNHIIKELNICLRVAKELGKASGNLATPEQVAKHLDRSPEDVRWLMSFAPGAISMDQTIGEDNEKTIMDTIMDENAIDPAQILEDASFGSQIEHWLSKLDERYRQVINLRFGLNGFEATTLEKISEMLCITRERVRQIQAEAMEWLKEMFLSEA